MASTYENDLRLEEMATGENSGSWGTKTNTNLELIADAFSYGTETIANADTTITIADGAADAARSLALKINSSADLTTTRTITLAPNTTSKVWIIENNTSGGQTLTISAGSGSNVTLANGTTKIIATDGIGAGSNVVELTQDLAIADMSVDGILSLADGSNSAPSLTNTGDTNTGLYFPAADEVGITTGGTQRVKVDSTGVDITGTAVTDGVTSSGVISAEKARSNTAGDGQILISPSDTTVEFAFRHDQTDNKLVLDATTSGTWGPNASFNTNKDIIFYDTSGNASFVYDESAGTTFNEAGADRDFRVESDGNANMLFVDGGTDRIGIGTSNPSTFIHAQSSGDIQFRFETTSDSTAQIQYKNGNHQWSAGIDNSEQFFIYDSTNAHSALTFIPLSAVVFNQNSADVDFRVESNDSTHMLFVDAGTNRVGIGQSGPGSILHMRETSDVASTLTFDHLSGGNAYGGYIQSLSGTNQGFNMGRKFNASYTRQMTATTTEIAFNEDSLDQDFRVESNNRTHMLYVDSDQNEVGINTSTPGSTLEVNGNFRPTYYYPHAPTSQTSSNNNNYWKLGNMYLPGPYGAEIVMHGAKPGYSSGGTNVGKLTILLRGGTNASLLDAVFYAEGDTSSVPCQSVRYVPNGNYEFEIYVQLGNYTSTSHTVVTGGSWTENVVNTGSTSAPANSVGIPAELSTWLGPREVMTQTQTMTTINETSYDHDFRVESDANAHAIFVDAAAADGGDILFGVSSRVGMYNGTGANGVAIEKLGDQGTTLVVQSSTNSCMYLSNPSGNSNDNFIIFSDAGGTVGSIAGTSSGTTYNTTSDRRLKTDIQPIADGTDKLMAMNPVTHKWIAEPEADAVHGFIAQEMQDVVPEAVSGDPDGDDMMSMDYGRITPVIVAALQDAHNKITALEKRLAELEAK